MLQTNFRFFLMKAIDLRKFLYRSQVPSMMYILDIIFFQMKVYMGFLQYKDGQKVLSSYFQHKTVEKI